MIMPFMAIIAFYHTKFDIVYCCFILFIMKKYVIYGGYLK